MYSPFAVAFVLKLTAGNGKGTEYRFEDGQEAKLGRTADNDVVVKDAAASRSHARVFQKGGKFFVEDLGSANGTNVNRSKIDGIKELRRGDAVVIGDVVLAFFAQEAIARSSPDSTVDDGSIDDEEIQDNGDDASEPTEDPSATILKPLARRAPPPRRPTRNVPVPAESFVDEEPAPDESDVDEPPPPDDEREAAQSVSGESEVPEDDEPSLENNSTKAFEVPPPRALTRAGDQRAIRPARSKTGTAIEANDGMSAAERARMRRQMQQSSGGRLQLMWDEMPKAARAALVGFMGLMVVGSLGLVFWAVQGRTTTNKVEPKILQPNGQAIADSFGLGDDVTFITSDQKTFTFTTASATRVVGVVHYQARNISHDEVTISLNGADLGTVPPDTMDAESRELDLVLPATQLRRAEEVNSLAFDSVLNPPARDPWKVWNIWVEINPVPEMSAEDAERRAQESIDRATVLAERRDIGAENLFSAWKTYREAWLLLEATPSHSVELDTIARTRMRELRPELDRKCNKMIIEVKKAMNQKVEDIPQARAILEDVPRYFPSREHPCLGFSQALLRDLETVDELPTNE